MNEKCSELRTSHFFHGYAEDFSAIYGNEHSGLNRFVNEYFRKSMRLRFEKTIEGCQPINGRSVIDIGCGGGNYGIALAKRGADQLLGLDFADGMLEIARKTAIEAGISEKCEFQRQDFVEFSSDIKFDYAIVMGFMDYMPDPLAIIRNVLSLTARRAVFSFPISGGFLAWQRKIRYKARCDLFLYSREDVDWLFGQVECKEFTIEKIARDYFVSVDM